MPIADVLCAVPRFGLMCPHHIVPTPPFLPNKPFQVAACLETAVGRNKEFGVIQQTLSVEL